MALSLPRTGLVAASIEAAPDLDALYRQHFRGVWRTLRRLGVPDAQLDDAAQEVFLVVHRKLEGFDGRSLRSWLYAITVRVASDQRKLHVRRRAASLDETLAAPASSPAELSEAREDVKLLHALLSGLGDKKRTVFVLSELEQLTVPEIAEALGENVNTVYARLRAARAQFEAALARYRAAGARERGTP